jgi:hypothetical protein
VQDLDQPFNQALVSSYLALVPPFFLSNVWFSRKSIHQKIKEKQGILKQIAEISASGGDFRLSELFLGQWSQPNFVAHV